MAKASAAPATKKDIRLIADEMKKTYATKGDFQMLKENVDQLQTHIMQSFHELRGEMKEWKSEIIHEFHVVAEDMRHDAFGIQKDRIADHEHRITRLERRTGVKA